jgi:hypothetical protein
MEDRCEGVKAIGEWEMWRTEEREGVGDILLWGDHLSIWDRAICTCAYRGREKWFDSSPLLGPMCVFG